MHLGFQNSITIGFRSIFLSSKLLCKFTVACIPSARYYRHPAVLLFFAPVHLPYPSQWISYHPTSELTALDLEFLSVYISSGMGGPSQGDSSSGGMIYTVLSGNVDCCTVDHLLTIFVSLRRSRFCIIINLDFVTVKFFKYFSRFRIKSTFLQRLILLVITAAHFIIDILHYRILIVSITTGRLLNILLGFWDFFIFFLVLHPWLGLV